VELGQFLGNLENVRKQGAGYLASCPAHADQHPSLSIGEGEEGRILVRCWAGCPTSSVLAALGLSFADLYPQRSQHRRRAGRPW
jgi:putative DNA primase/helicase